MDGGVVAITVVVARAFKNLSQYLTQLNIIYIFSDKE